MQQLQIGELFYKCAAAGLPIHQYKTGCDIIDLTGTDLKVKTKFGKFVPINFISRHRTRKALVQFKIKSECRVYTVTVTTDHVCMIYTKDHLMENLAAKEIKLHDYVSVIKDDVEYIGEITEIFNLGRTTDFVYDLEVDDDLHCFYANNVLVHNSLFTNIKCVTDYFKKEYNLPAKLREWPDEYKFKLWEYMEHFVNDEVTPNVRKLLQTECHCEDTSMLGYELEYIASSCIAQAKKSYAMYKMVTEGPVLSNNIKYAGLELKRATLPSAIKDALAEIYQNTLALNWTEQDFRDYIYKVYDKFITLPIEDIAQWKGYSTAKHSTGFLQIEQGASGIAKACQYYNDLLKQLNLGRKYDEIHLNDKVRFVYLVPNNRYNIKCIAFKDHWPEEFNDIFQIDYSLMFDKCVISPLKNFMHALHYSEVDPKQKMLFDIFEEF